MMFVIEVTDDEPERTFELFRVVDIGIDILRNNLVFVQLSLIWLRLLLLLCGHTR